MKSGSARCPSAVRSSAWVATFAVLHGACALSAPPAEQTLSPSAASATAVLDALAQRALAAARREPADARVQVEASALLFQAADLRLQSATVAWLDEHRDANRAMVLLAEDRLSDEVRSAIASLCTEGLACAERAAHLGPADASALLHQGLHLSLLAWANGPARSLLAGYGGRLVAAIDAALAADAGFDGGAPLRLQGRFRSKAPWPYGDLPVALAALGRAVAVRSVPVNHLFHGDALAAAGDAAAAERQWHLCIDAVADESTRWSADLLRELARRRLAARP